MLTKKLIEILSSQDPESEVLLFWDGYPRGKIEGVYTETGQIVLVGEWETYSMPRFEKERRIIYSD